MIKYMCVRYKNDSYLSSKTPNGV